MTLEDLDKELYGVVVEACGRNNLLKPMDVQKKVMAKHSDVEKNDVKFSIKRLVDGGRLEYAYLGGSFLVTPEWAEKRKH